MRNCPFCKAQIEDEARFCLYCMRPLVEKEVVTAPAPRPKWWVFAAPAAVLLLAAAILLWAFWGSAPGSPQLDALAGTTQGTAPVSTGSSETSLPAQSAPPTESTTSSLPPQTEPPASVTNPPVTEPPASVTNPPVTEPPADTVIYSYRLATDGDDFYALYKNPGNDIVITGILTPAEDGVYHIPAYIDGKRVLTIGEDAFSGSNATTVYIPATVRNIDIHAFAPCGLTDLYLYGESLHIDNHAFNSSFTLHCSAECNDRNFRLFKNTADIYGATWEEWNG